MEKTKHLDKSAVYVSIGLAIYNEEKNIEKAINAILNQSFRNFELIISDDCSKDKTYFLCKKYAEIDHRIKLHRQDKNIGVAENFNFVFKKSKHEFFIWLAGDDEISEDYLEGCIETLIEDKNCVFSAPNHCYRGDELNKKKHFSFSIRGSLYQKGNFFLKNCFNATGCNFALFRREVLETVPEMDKKFLGHDWKVLSHALSQGDFVRSKKGLLILGRGGLSSSPDFMGKEARNIIEHIMPLFEFSKFFFKKYLLSRNLKLLEKLTLFFILAKLNFLFIFLKYLNLLKTIIKKSDHPKLKDAYK